MGVPESLMHTEMKAVQLITLVSFAFILSEVKGKLFGRRDHSVRKTHGRWRKEEVEDDHLSKRNNPRRYGESSWRRQMELAKKRTVVPDFYTVSSADGLASEIQWNRMGKYEKSIYENNGHPVWINHDGNQMLFYASDGKWVIGDPATEIGGLESVERGQDNVPSHPWRYYSDD